MYQQPDDNNAELFFKLPLNSKTTVHKNLLKLWDYPGSFMMDNGRNKFCKGNH
jgi:hypothetical protein